MSDAEIEALKAELGAGGPTTGKALADAILRRYAPEGNAEPRWHLVMAYSDEPLEEARERALGGQVIRDRDSILTINIPGLERPREPGAEATKADTVDVDDPNDRFGMSNLPDLV